MSGQTGSNTEKQNFCYDEQNRLIWASNTATPPSAGNGTCGSLTPSSGFNGAGYTSSFVYTHLGQLWQAPLNGTGSNQQYLYCTGSTPHQLQGIYPSGATCSNPGTANYAVQYDNWGNVTKRTYNNQTATLSYNKLDQMVEWQIPGTNQAWYAYNANGDRTIQRTTIGSTTNITVYAFGLEEYTYDGSGNLQSGTHYYSLAGHLIGELTGTGTLSTNFFMTDALDSILATFSNTATSAAILGNQLYGPYGNPRYQAGSMGTNKGFTGQYNDPVSGLDYYNSRYYDSVAGMFLSIDLEQGNMQGMNPYNYVGENPETRTDPTGKYFAPPGSGGNGGTPPSCVQLHDCNPIESGGGYTSPKKPPLSLSSSVHAPKHLTSQQLENWCLHDTKCFNALLSYQIAQQQAAYEQGALIMLAFFAAFEGDPEALQQATEEDTLLWQQLAEEEDVSLDDAVSTKLASNDPAQRAEGEAGAIASIYSKLIRFSEKFGKNGEYGEVDAETPDAVIEAKSGGLAGQMKDLIKKFNNIAVNPDRKPFVIYAPSWNEKNAQTVYETLGNLDTGQEVYVATNQEQLIEILQYLQEESP